MHTKAFVRAPDGYSHMRADMDTIWTSRSTTAIVGLHSLGGRTCMGEERKSKGKARIPSILLLPHGSRKHACFLRFPAAAFIGLGKNRRCLQRGGRASLRDRSDGDVPFSYTQ
ncbi:uncharacterized protein TRIVIDRAFT_221884 [Trichoderma virens Gv29-8]|uniref:Uncharacterized protein n=1 Tax=Hypocrea virens (strain Gv29-8 / FGSC 10586) TaxID=413071 RepID=G9MR91_HYPVG|nr:uncharacterized protein TRIVIDRAFT_221884 [Trichoderma virens Gv29-8]EHK22615.1 hypothetical protein TRIVIDRAFT_221884 [Trichoderma virens Gv29-8]UKZ47665.1 hypothetical protein TrVGV298_001889 [Trichoderma virens]